MAYLLFGISLNVLAFLSATNADTCDSFQELRCSAARCNISGNSVILKEGRSLSCTVSYIADKKIPKIKANTLAAPPLNFLNVACYQTFSPILGKYKAALDVVWISEVIHIRDGNVKGYFIDFGLTTFKVTLEFRDTEVKTEKVADCVKFSHNCYGVKYSYLNPGREIVVSVRPRPRPQRYDSYNLKQNIYKVPKVQQCQLNVTATTDVPQKSEYYPLSKASNGTSLAIEIYIIAAAAFVIMMVIIGVAVCFLRKKRNNQKETDSKEERAPLVLCSKHILLVANRKKTLDCERAQMLANKLRRTKWVLSVTCDFENTKQTVHQQRLPTWFIQARQKADTVIFVNGAGILRQIRENSEDSKIPRDDFIFEIYYHFHENDFANKKNIFLEDTDEHAQYFKDSGGSSCEVFTFEDLDEDDGLYRHLFYMPQPAYVEKSVKDEKQWVRRSKAMLELCRATKETETNEETIKTTTV